MMIVLFMRFVAVGSVVACVRLSLVLLLCVLC